MSTASEWSTVIIGGVQFAAGIWLTARTLSTQHNENISQREAIWFHKVVVEPAIATLHQMVEVESRDLETSALKCQQAKLGNFDQVTVDECFRQEIRTFKQRLTPIQKKLTQLAFVFDGDLNVHVSSKFQDLEDGVTEWFDRFQNQAQADGQKSLMQIVCDCQRELLNVFREFEFSVLPQIHAPKRKSAFRLGSDLIRIFGLPLLCAACGVIINFFPSAQGMTLDWTQDKTVHAIHIAPLVSIAGILIGSVWSLYSLVHYVSQIRNN